MRSIDGVDAVEETWLWQIGTRADVGHVCGQQGLGADGGGIQSSSRPDLKAKELIDYKGMDFSRQKLI